jgi:hypothetical protein
VSELGQEGASRWLYKATWARMGLIRAARACSGIHLTGTKEWVSWAPLVSPASRRFLGVVVPEPVPGWRGTVAVLGIVGADGCIVGNDEALGVVVWEPAPGGCWDGVWISSPPAGGGVL